jgi:hypothetical protein
MNSTEEKKASRRVITARTRAKYKKVLKRLGLNSTEKLMGKIVKMSPAQLMVLRELIS